MKLYTQYEDDIVGNTLYVSRNDELLKSFLSNCWLLYSVFLDGSKHYYNIFFYSFLKYQVFFTYSTIAFTERYGLSSESW